MESLIQRPRAFILFLLLPCLFLLTTALKPSFSSTIEGKGVRPVVTFDLDDTFWNTERVVNKANEKITELYGLEPAAVMAKMKELRRAAGGAPVSYTEMRTEAYRALLGRGGGAGEGAAEAAFAAWLAARDAAALEDLAPDVVPCLREFAAAGWLVGAVTNGRGSARRLPPLAGLVAFEVSGEDEGVFPHRKPAREIYEAAVARARAECGWSGGGGGGGLTEWWHVGDCGVNDVQGAATAGMKTVLVKRPEYGGGPGGNPFEQGQSPKAYSFSTLSPEETAAREQKAMAAVPDHTCAGLAGLCGELTRKRRSGGASLLPPPPPVAAKRSKRRRLAATLRRLLRPGSGAAHEATVRAYFAAVEAQDLEQVRACFAERVELVDVCGLSKGEPRWATPEDMAARCGEFLAAHPDCRVHFHHPPTTAGTGRWVWAHWYETGTWTGRSLGAQPTGAPLEVQGQTRFRLDAQDRIEKLVVTRTFSDWEVEVNRLKNEDAAHHKDAEAKEAVVDRYFRAVTAKDLAAVEACFAPEVTLVDVLGPAGPAPRTATARQMAERVGEFVAAHPDCAVAYRPGGAPAVAVRGRRPEPAEEGAWGPEEQEEEGEGSEWVWAHWYEEGTWSGESRGIAPRGSPLAVEGQTRFLVNAQGKIEKLVVTRTFSEWELLAAAQQQQPAHLSL